MEIEIDVVSTEPVYEQIVRQVQQGVMLGNLVPGTPLPSIRQLAHDLDLNHNTVAKAYKILEANRVIRTAGQKGTFIHSDAMLAIDQRNLHDTATLMREMVASLVGKGLSPEQIRNAFDAAMLALTNQPTANPPPNPASSG